MKTCAQFLSDSIDAVFLTEAASRSGAGRLAADRVASTWPHAVRLVSERSAIPRSDRNRRTLIIDIARGRSFGRCPGSNGHICCNLHTVDLYIGCSIGCSYCIMNEYLNFAPLVVQADVAPVVEAIRGAALSDPNRIVRVGSGEVGDSLLLDPVFKLNEEIISAVAELPNVLYEAKTKTNYVDHLLTIEDKGGAVIAFSLNPEHIVTLEEGIAATAAERLEAAKKCVKAGYHVAFHFDPIIKTESFPGDYLQLINDMSSIPADAISWISMGTIRFPPSLKDSFSDRPFSAAEFVPTRDGKLRYLQPVRREVYATLRAALTDRISAPVYLCMESPTMWDHVFGDRPENHSELRAIFSRSVRH